MSDDQRRDPLVNAAAEGGLPSGAVSSGGGCWGSPGAAGSARTSQPVARVLACGSSAEAAEGAASAATQTSAAPSGWRAKNIVGCNRGGILEVAAVGAQLVPA